MAREYHFGDPDRPRWGATDPRPGASGDAFGEARLGREVEDLGRTSGREVHEGFVRNFLPESQRRTWTESVEQRAAARRQILAAHPDRAAQIRQRAALGQQIAREQVISGTNTVSNGRFVAKGLAPRYYRDKLGRIRIDWSQAGLEDDEDCGRAI